MPPLLHLYQVRFGSGRGGPFLVVAASFGDAETRALAFATKALDSTHQTINSITVVALGCDIVNGKLTTEGGVP